MAQLILTCNSGTHTAKASCYWDADAKVWSAIGGIENTSLSITAEAETLDELGKLFLSRVDEMLELLSDNRIEGN